MRILNCVWISVLFFSTSVTARHSKIADLKWSTFDRQSVYQFFALTCSVESWKAFYSQITKVKRKLSNSIPYKDLENDFSNRSFSRQDILYSSETGRWSIKGISDIKLTNDICRLFLSILSSETIHKKTKNGTSSLLNFLLPLAHADVRLDGRFLDYVATAIIVVATGGCIIATLEVGTVICTIMGAGAVGGIWSIHNDKLKLYKFFDSNFEITCSNDKTIYSNGKELIIVEKKGKEKTIELRQYGEMLSLIDYYTFKTTLPVAHDSISKLAGSCNSSQDADRFMAELNKKKMNLNRRAAAIDDLKIEMMPKDSVNPNPSFEDLSKPTER